MNPELEALLKAWDAYLQAQAGEEADRVLARYEAQLGAICARRKISRELLDRAVQRSYQR